MRRRATGGRPHGMLRVRRDPEDAALRRARVASWSRRARAKPGGDESSALVACAAMFGECAQLIAAMRAELERAHDLDSGARAQLYELMRDIIDVEQLGRVALLAALLPTTERPDA